jgi:hypothetical protein
MAEEQQRFASEPETEDFGLSFAADTEAFAGHDGKARELTKRAADSAIHADAKENGAIWWENAALREAAFGNFIEARGEAAAGLRLAGASPSVQAEAALAYAMTGDTARAETLAQDLNQRHRADTQIQSVWLPAIRGQMALNAKDPAATLDRLEPAAPMSREDLSYTRLSPT